MNPTAEQEKILEAARTGKHLSVEAYAGTGKTSTLEMLAKDRGERMTYVAFNRDVVTQARSRFPNHVKCSTAHGLAFGPYGSQQKHRLDWGKPSPADLAKILKTERLETVAPSGRKKLTAPWFGGMALKTIQKFCETGDPMIRARHMDWPPAMKPLVEGAQDPWFDIRQEAGPLILKYARAAWQDITSTSGVLKWEHDYYLKAWQLSEPRLCTDVILFDEAQDASGVMLAVAEAQRDHAQLIYVGDRYQAIYGWRGAVNAMEQVNVDKTLHLTGSFRFGEGIAEEANRLLVDILDAPVPVKGLGPRSRLGRSTKPDVTLCRSNSGIITNVIDDLVRGKKVALVGGTGQVVAFARGARDLQEGRESHHPDLSWASSWEEIQEYAATDPMGDDLAGVVKVIDQHGAKRIIDLLYKCVAPEWADVVYSTAHKAKGLEWPTVRIHSDFPEPDLDILNGEVTNLEEMRLAYVALTRAQVHLDHTAVEWMVQGVLT